NAVKSARRHFPHELRAHILQCRRMRFALARNKPSCEEALQRLEKIVEAIEGGKVGLEDSIKQFDEGMQLIQHCRGILADAEMKIQKLQTNPQGELEATPMEGPADAAGTGEETF